jgi:hypothetical protein
LREKHGQTSRAADLGKRQEEEEEEEQETQTWQTPPLDEQQPNQLQPEQHNQQRQQRHRPPLAPGQDEIQGLLLPARKLAGLSGDLLGPPDLGLEGGVAHHEPFEVPSDPNARSAL